MPKVPHSIQVSVVDERRAEPNQQTIYADYIEDDKKGLLKLGAPILCHWRTNQQHYLFERYVPGRKMAAKVALLNRAVASGAYRASGACEHCQRMIGSLTRMPKRPVFVT